MKKCRIIIPSVIILLIAILVGARLYLPYYAKDYVNNVISNINGYSGSVSDVDINLWRGAYTLYNIEINKKNAGIPVPFVDIKALDIAVQWRMLFHGRVVAVFDFKNPAINFAVSKDGITSQTGTEADWTEPLNKLMPIKINLLTIDDGKVTYQDFSATPKVDIYIKNISAQARNIRNVVNPEKTLPSSFNLTGSSVGGGELAINGDANFIKKVIDFDLNGQMENINLPALNTYTHEYAYIDFEKGILDVYTELKVRDGQLTGYVKPLAKNVSFVNLAKEKNPVHILWESLAATLAMIFKNQPKDQLATKIPLEGNVSDPKVSILPTLGGILKNAFIESYKNGIDHTVNSSEIKK